MQWLPRLLQAAQAPPWASRFWSAVALYLATTIVYAVFASPGLWVQHTPYNHFALQAEAWLDGDLHLAAGPPAYAGGNDFAHFQGRWFVVFPPFPALVLVPFVWLAGSAQALAEGQVFLLLAGLAPAFLFLALERARDLGLAWRRTRDHLWLSALFAFGSVYFFTAVQGTVWFAAHVLGTVCLSLYLLLALGGRTPVLAGLALACAFLSRTPVLLAGVFFLVESLRLAHNQGSAKARWWLLALPSLGRFMLAPCLTLVLTLFYNQARFGDAFEFGYQYLAIRWQDRIQAWGLFHYHYLARNLGVILTSLPWYAPDGPVPFRINAHGLALWVTSPFYLLLLRGAPHWRSWLAGALWLSLCLVALPTLFYQNSGWVQFGYRFSNDYAPLLFFLLALSRGSFGRGMALLGVAAVTINAFGAWSFARMGAYADYYFIDGTQRILYQPDRR